MTKKVMNHRMPRIARKERINIEGICVECCVFDLDGTLYSSTAGVEFALRPAMVEAASEVLGVDKSEAQRLLSRYRSMYKSSVLGLERFHKIDPNGFLELAFSKLDVTEIVPNGGLASALKALAEIVPLVVITNSYRTHASRVLALLDLSDVFTFVCSVDVMEFIRKPNPEAFETLVGILPMDPTAAMLFDDSFLNLETAKRFGFQTALVSNGIAPGPPLFWEMHQQVMHMVPECADISTHNLVDLLDRNLSNHMITE